MIAGDAVKSNIEIGGETAGCKIGECFQEVIVFFRGICRLIELNGVVAVKKML